MLENLDPTTLLVLLALVGERALSWLRNRGIDLQVMSENNGYIPEMREQILTLVEQHKYPDQHGFGSTHTNRLLEDLLKAQTEAAEKQGDLADLIKEFIMEMKLERRSATLRSP